MTVKIRWSGFLYTNENFANNIPYYKHCLDHEVEARRVGVTPEKARAEVAFLERFPPEIPHDRLVGHRVEVYVANNLGWSKKGRGKYVETRFGRGRDHSVIPSGFNNLVFSEDLGVLIGKLCEQECIEESLDDNVERDNSDGTVTVGRLVRRSCNEGAATRRVLKNPYLNIFYDASRFGKQGNFGYDFDIKTDAIKSDKPFKVRVVTYLKMNNEVINEESEIARPEFRAIFLENGRMLAPQFVSMKYVIN